MPRCAEQQEKSTIYPLLTNPLLFLSLHHAFQLLTQCVPDPPLPRPLLTQFHHPTAR